MLNGGVSIIIPTKDRGDVFNKTLSAAYDATDFVTSEIIVINDSKILQPFIDTKYKDRVRLFDNPGNGVASARNFGVKNSNYSNLLFLDDDIIISPETIQNLIPDIQQYPNSAINFNWIYPLELTKKIGETQFGSYLIKNGFTSLKGWSDKLKWNDTEIFEVDFIASYFLFISKENFNALGGYNESFPHAGAEDFDFAVRLKKQGIIGICDPLNIVLHNEEDRVHLLSWLQRKERGGETRKIAADIGHKEIEMRSSPAKIKFYSLVYNFKPLFFFCLKLIPNIRALDFLYFKITNLLLAAYLYKGYFNSK